MGEIQVPKDEVIFNRDFPNRSRKVSPEVTSIKHRND